MNEVLEALETIKNAPTIYVGCMSNVYTRYRWEVELIEKELEEKSYLQKFISHVFDNLEIEVEDNSYEDEDGHAYYGLTFICKNGDRFSISCSKQEHKYWFGDGDGPYGPEDLK